MEDNLDILIKLAIEEDIGAGDVTSEAIFTGKEKSEAKIISKSGGIFCGAGVINRCYNCIDPRIKITHLAEDGRRIKPGHEVARVYGSVKSILAGERITLNFIQRMSGIATKTDEIVSLLKGTGIKILDTRKTLPGFRMLDKYSVKTGGGTNHRIGLFDMVMIKDNHIKAAGSISEAVRRVREKYKSAYKIEVETTNLSEVKEAVMSGADIIMLDNMSRQKIIESIEIIEGRAEIEVSGSMDKARVKEIIDLKISYISMGALTHSVNAFDLSMKFS